MMKIAFLSPYPFNAAPSQRFRYEHYFKYAQAHGMQYDLFPFLDEAGWQVLYQRGNAYQKAQAVIRGIARRIAFLLKAQNYHAIYLHREATPLGPPIFEWLIAKIWRKPIIYDFDDAIWLPNTSHENRWVAWFKWHVKVKRICKWAKTVSCGNEYLADYARQYNNDVRIVPTVVDTENQHNRLKSHNDEKVTLGWTGSHSTLKYLDAIVPVLQELEEELEFNTVVIADRNPEIPLRNFQFVPWRKESEIEDLLQIHIGLMPLEDNPWAKGKCGFKAIQYMALGIPALVSPVGINSEIVTHGREGFHCEKAANWKKHIKEVIVSTELRTLMGQAGRKKIIEEYSVQATQAAFFQLFEDAISHRQ